MAILEMRRASFARGRTNIVAPISLQLEEGGTLHWRCELAQAGRVLARMAAGIVKCTAGSVFIGDYDPKIQPVQVKRLVGFIPHPPPSNPFDSPQAYFAYRSDLWNLQCASAVERGMRIFLALHAQPPNLALAVSGALLHEPKLLVAENLEAELFDELANLRGAAALFATR
ncbi:MAG: hypothetical protein DLM50_01455 [Candidatus Meridianibacter frigidus]|nr:MAG: hypothetical protein DLM50_01455 [Candidatus Eremiobacteraeota bacterium]